MNGKNIAMPAPRAPYWKRMNAIRSRGMNLIARIDIADAIIHRIFLLSPSMPLFSMTVYTINRTIMNRISLEKRNSSKLLTSRMASLMNRTKM